jgi:sporulation protein YlmC with PRC-barrel domain
MRINLVRDVLDKKLMDDDDDEAGRVDGLVMSYGERTQPRITHIEIGGSILAARVHPFFIRISNWLARQWGPKRKGPVRIPWSRVVTVGRSIKLNVEAKETGAIDWEIWLARNVIERIPGGGTEEEGDGA